MNGMRHKYRAIKVILVENGVELKFPSKLEARRWLELRAMEKSGQIKDLKRQISFPCDVNGRHVTTYVADFTYMDEEGLPRVEDAKGFRTREYKLKKKLVEAVWDVEIKEYTGKPKWDNSQSARSARIWKG